MKKENINLKKARQETGEREKVYLSLRLKKNEYVELEEQIWFQLYDLGLEPGMSCYYQGIKVTKTKGFAGFNLAAKYQRNYRGNKHLVFEIYLDHNCIQEDKQ